MFLSVFFKGSWLMQLIVGIGLFACSFFLEYRVLRSFFSPQPLALLLAVTLECGKISAIIWHYYLHHLSEHEYPITVRLISLFFRLGLIMKRRAMVIAYDITDNKRRRKLFRVLKSWKLSAQYSVFECKLTQAEASELFLQLTDLLNEEEDMLLLARLDNTRKSKGLTRCSGIGFKVPVLYMG